MTQNEIHGVRPSSPRILPLPWGEQDAESRLLIASIGSSATDNTFDTLIRHPDLLRQWMPFTVALAVTGVLSPRLREIAIRRRGWVCGAEYEWGQHAVLARKVGVSDEEIARVKRGPEAEGWTELEAAVLRAADELHSDACITDETWAVLAAYLDERQLIEVHNTGFLEAVRRAAERDERQGMTALARLPCCRPSRSAARLTTPRKPVLCTPLMDR